MLFVKPSAPAGIEDLRVGYMFLNYRQFVDMVVSVDINPDISVDRAFEAWNRMVGTVCGDRIIKLGFFYARRWRVECVTSKLGAEVYVRFEYS